MPADALGIAIHGDLQLGLQHIPRTRHLVYQLRERMKFNGVQVLSTQLRLDSTSYVYAYAFRGITRAVIYAGYGAETAAEQVSATRTPDFWSGVVIAGQELDVRFKPTPACAQFHSLEEQYAPALRLSVAAHTDVPEIDVPRADEPVSQYFLGKATLWTGTMRIVVQALLGFGKPVAPSIYDTEAPTSTEAPTASAYEQRIARTGVQIRYGARFERTHGITIASDDVPWLIEISITRGVLAMPLPVFPATTTAAFRARVEEMEDAAALDLLDRFGGFPSGEVFPVHPDALEAGIRAGIILRLRTHSDLSGLFEHRSYSSAMSWAFSDTGHDAVTTCYRTGTDHIQRGSWWGVALSIGDTEPAEATNANVLREAFADQGTGELHEWILRKLERMTQDQVTTIIDAAAYSKPAAYRQLDELELDPMAIGTARVSKRGEGYLWAHFLTRYFPPIAYHSPEFGYCRTHDPRPGMNLPRPRGIINTVMWVAYCGQRLAWVRYFDDTRNTPARVDDGHEECMFQGTWVKTIETDAREPERTFFSSEFDYRRPLAGHRTINTVNGRSMGYTQVQVENDITFPPLGRLRRRKSFRMTITNDAVSGEGQSVGIVFPQGDRCAYYYAVVDSDQGASRVQSRTTYVLEDPNQYVTWRNFPGYTGSTSGPIYSRVDHPDGCGPVDANTVRVGEYFVDLGCNVEHANQGQWAAVCQNADALVYNIPDLANTTVVTSTPQRQILRAWLANATDVSPIRVAQDTKYTPQTVDGSWFRTSPDPVTGAVIVAASWHNAWGDAIGIAYQTTADNPDVGEQLIFAYPDQTVMQQALDENQSFTFVGRVD